ncbi:MAG: M48 family metalloprotease [Candidatus Omnitrophica bacterium]|nr:M48 family metalloprotease [Candidatus Omnitrophota bacterium]
MWYLKLRMYLLMAVLFAIIYAIVSMISFHLGITNFYFYLVLSFVIMFVQYMVGPKMVEWSMGVKYIKDNEYPELHETVRSLAAAANIPTPKIGISDIAIPNAFAFGRSRKDGRICVTRGIMSLLNKDELRAVLGHEMSHIKNRDVLTITLLSVIPMILYRIAWQFLFYGRGRNDRNQSSAALVGLAAFIFYFITNLLVLYASRIREYFADKGSVDLGSNPANLASALYKLVYGSARMPKEELKNAEGMKAFFVNDPSRALGELRDLRGLDLDRSGTISQNELDALRDRDVKLNFGDKLLEVFSTHPNMLKRIKRLSGWKNA